MKVKVAQSSLTLCGPMDYTVHGILQARILEKGQATQSSIREPQGKPKNTGVGSLSLLWGNFLTQESKGGFLHCRWILYQLSYEGSPREIEPFSENELANHTPSRNLMRTEANKITPQNMDSWASLVAQLVKNLPVMWETGV